MPLGIVHTPVKVVGPRKYLLSDELLNQGQMIKNAIGPKAIIHNRVGCCDSKK